MTDNSLAKQLEECTERCRNMDAPLAERLAAFANDVRTLDQAFASVVDRMVARLQSSGVGENSPRPGEPMPEFLLPDQSGHLVTLASLIEQGPVVIAFHRGHWCPYCRINASALASIQDEVAACGGSLVAITPEIQSFNAELRDEAKAAFPILSDMDNAYALELNIAFYVGDEKRQVMQAAGWDISPFQGNTSWTLPVPATFVVGEDGLVKARFIDPDYRRRADLDEVLKAVRPARH